MLDADAEAEGANRANVRDVPLELFQHQGRTRVVAGVAGPTASLVVPVRVQRTFSKVGQVQDPEILKRDEKLLVECLPQPQLMGDVSIEIGKQQTYRRFAPELRSDPAAGQGGVSCTTAGSTGAGKWWHSSTTTWRK